MKTDVEQSFCGGWPPEELSDGDDKQEISVSQTLDRGSVSFGRFSVESLSWERKSVFAHDRRQEELEKFNGLVAKKKAYFEERYRRMRALKAAQRNQQTELVLDYGGGDGSNSSQSGEEDEKDSQSVDPRGDGPANIDSTPSKEDANAEAAVVRESSWSGSQQAHKPDQEFSSSVPSSSEERLANVEQDKNYSGTLQVEPATMEMESSLPLREDAEEGEPNQSNSHESREVSRKPENLASNLKPGAAAIKLSGSKRESYSQVNQLGSLKKSQGHRSVSKTKDSVIGTRRGPGLKRELKPNVGKPSKAATNSLRQTVGTAENSRLTRSTNVSKFNNSSRSSSLSSKRPVTEARTERPNLNTRGTFSLAMEKRANSKGSEVNQDSRTPNKVVSSFSHSKGGLSVQDASSKKPTETPATKNMCGTESKRGSKEAQMKPPASDSKTSFKKIEQSLHVPKSRSVNLPAKNKSGSTSGVALQPAVVKGAKKKETSSVQKTQQSHSSRKQQFDNLSLDGRKTKQETQQWR